MHLPNYQPPNPMLWQGRQDALNERFFQSIAFIKNPNELINTSPKTIFLGFASDTGIIRNLGRPGAKFGPDSLKSQLAKLPLHEAKEYVDIGTIVCEGDALESAELQFAELISFCHQQGHSTIAFGGGHEIAFGHYLGLAPHYPNLGIINFDAHFDIRPYKKGQPGTSGTPFSQIANFCEENHRLFDYHCVGIQEFGNTNSLFQRAKELNVSYLNAKDINELPLTKQLATLDGWMDGFDHLYLSICLDVLAECFAPGVSAPAPLGLSPWQILPLLKHIMKSKKVVSIDVAELSPPLDQNEKTARLAALIIGELLNS